MKNNRILLALALTAAMHSLHAAAPVLQSSDRNVGGPARRPVHRSFSAGGSVNEGGCGDLAATFNSTPPHFLHK